MDGKLVGPNREEQDAMESIWAEIDRSRRPCAVPLPCQFFARIERVDHQARSELGDEVRRLLRQHLAGVSPGAQVGEGSGVEQEHGLHAGLAAFATRLGAVLYVPQG